jgi:hypothetical protein
MKIFLSAVSAQFRECRNALASDLRAVGVEVAFQEDFQQHGRTLLEKLLDYIAGCDRVIALAGDAYGYEPGPAARPAGQPRRSYTQWEYYFALGERLDGLKAPRKDIYVYFADAGYLAAHPPPADQTPEQAELQERFRAAIRGSGEDRNTFGSLDALCRLALRDGFRVRDPDRKPINLPDLSLGSLFKGRDAFVEDLRRRLGVGPGRAAAIVARQAVHGLGGVGKTRAAIEYAWRFADDYTALLFVSAPSAAELKARLADLVGILAIETAEKEVERRRDAVIRWLDDHPGWLLILDNVDSQDSAREVQRLLAELKAGHVLITSRIANWRAGIVPLELRVLDRDDAAAFLLERTPHRRRKPDDADRAAEVARELDGLALALEQAGAYIDILHLSFAEYLGRWEAKRAEVLMWHDEQAMGYPASVAATWETSFAQLNAAEQTLLHVLAWLAPEPIPLTLFEAGPLTAAVAEARDTLAGLARYSLARFAAEGDSVEVHRLVQEIARGRIPEADRTATLQVALNAVDAVTAGDPEDVQTFAVWTPLVAHAEAVSRFADAAKLAEPAARLMNQLGFYWYTRGHFNAAEPLMRRALAIDERNYGPDDPGVARDLNNLAKLLLLGADRLRKLSAWDVGIGRFLVQLLVAHSWLSEAESLSKRAVRILIAFRRKSGHEHPDFRTGLANYRELLEASGRSPDEIERRLSELDDWLGSEDS